MTAEPSTGERHVAFAGTTLIASGSLDEVARAAWGYLARGGAEPLAVFDDGTGRVTDLDLRGSLEEALARLPVGAAGEPKRHVGPGRPRLGVVSREVSLLPRHWEWLASQPGGASVALRKLVEKARKESQASDHARRCRDAAHAFIWAMAGDLEGFEEATRSFFAADYTRFDGLVEGWPADVRDQARRMVARLRVAEEAARAPRADGEPPGAGSPGQ